MDDGVGDQLPDGSNDDWQWIEQCDTREEIDRDMTDRSWETFY